MFSFSLQRFFSYLLSVFFVHSFSIMKFRVDHLILITFMLSFSLLLKAERSEKSSKNSTGIFDSICRIRSPRSRAIAALQQVIQADIKNIINRPGGANPEEIEFIRQQLQSLAQQQQVLQGSKAAGQPLIGPPPGSRQKQQLLGQGIGPSTRTPARSFPIPHKSTDALNVSDDVMTTTTMTSAPGT